MTADEIVSLRARLAGSEEWLKGCNSRLVEVLRERDEARRAASDWHDEYVKMSETNLGNLGEFSKAKSAMRARIAELEEGLWLARGWLVAFAVPANVRIKVDALLARLPDHHPAPTEGDAT